MSLLHTSFTPFQAIADDCDRFLAIADTAFDCIGQVSRRSILTLSETFIFSLATAVEVEAGRAIH